jgi:hypothetical protein
MKVRLLLLIAVVCCVAYSWPLPGEEEKTKCFSPDGKFALRLGDQNNSGDSKTEIIELGTQKPVLELGILGHPNEEDAKLIWSPDSQRVAFFEPTKRGGLTHVYFRNGTLFEEIQLPTLPEPKTPKKMPADVYDKAITALDEPVRWLKSGALVIYSEVEGDHSGRAALEITIGFNENHKPSVVKSRKISPRPMESGG